MYKCDYCDDTERLFPDFRSYRMHCMKLHPGQPARREAFVPDDSHAEPEAEAESEPIPPVEPFRITKPIPYEPQDASLDDADSRLELALGDLSVKNTETILRAFKNVADTLKDNLANLTDEEWRGILETLRVKVLAFTTGEWDVEVLLPAMSIVCTTP